MEEKNIITQKGVRELKDELRNLIEVERPKAITDIKDARQQGDLSENAEFDAAREKQGQIEDRITEIERIISESKIVQAHKKKSSDVVSIGSTVVVVSKNVKSEYMIVGGLEADPIKGKISNVSPLGEALLQHKVGDEVSYVVETKKSTKKNKVTIKSIKN